LLIYDPTSNIQGSGLIGLGNGDHRYQSHGDDFESCSFSFSSRKTNVVAHKLARCAESFICSISVGVVPTLIPGELCNDVS
jgi:hypothetical protein